MAEFGVTETAALEAASYESKAEQVAFHAGYRAGAAELAAALECAECQKPRPSDGYADEALCYGPDGTNEPHAYITWKDHALALEASDVGEELAAARAALNRIAHTTHENDSFGATYMRAVALRALSAGTPDGND